MYEVVQGFRLSPQQRRLWQWQQNVALRSWCVVRIEGALDVSVLRRAIQSVISRHEVLRTFFHCPSEMSFPLQRIADESTPAWSFEDLTTLTSEEQEARIAALVQRTDPFDLEQGPLLRFDCLQLSSDNHALIITLPSLCADSLTLRNMVHDLGRCYTACRYESDGLPEPTQYVQFSEWANELQEEDDESGRNYWRCFHGVSLPTTLPYEKKSSAEFAFGSTPVSIPPGLSRDFLLACWQTLLWRLTNEHSVVIGVQFDGRKYDELNEALGLFAKYLPVQQDFADDPPFNKILESVSASCRDAYAWQEYFNWEECFDADFFPVQFSFEEFSPGEHSTDPRFSVARSFSGIEPHKLKLACVRDGDSLSAELHFDSNAFSAEHAQLIARCFETLVASVFANPELRASEFDIVSNYDLQQLSAWSRSPDIGAAPQKSIHGLFEEQVNRTPDAVAVVYNGRQLTYAQLDTRANEFASLLRQRGVGPNAIVGLCVTRSLEMMVGMLGILKAGGAYLPLDPEHPPARLIYQLSEGRSRILFTQEALFDLFTDFEGEVVYLDRDYKEIDREEKPALEGSPEDLAYVIFTSGSTGRPKGVEITHRNLVNYAWAMSQTLSLNGDPDRRFRFANVSTLSADLGNTGIFLSLISGGCLHILDHDVATDGDRFADYLIENSIDVLKIVPSHLNALLPSLKLKNAFPRKYAIAGGEQLSFDLVRSMLDLAGDCRIINHYGPTEATIGAVIYPVHEHQTDAAGVPIGRPIANMEVHILDERLRPVPPGLMGELYISGIGLAKGYLHQPEQTNARFIQNPFSTDPAARLYRTGDLARYLPDGNIEFCGRIDHQVKIRGYRIELGEIETALREHANVREAIVVAKEDEHGHKHLVAYCVPRHEPAPQSAELAGALKQKLPAYMIPHVFINLKAMPLTRNGKVAREALPEPQFGSTTGERALPQTEVEKKLAAIWMDVLGVKELSINDNFFEMGGDSVLSIQIIARARQAGLSISPKHVFDHPTIAALAQVAGTVTSTVFDQGLVTGELPLLPIQHWFFGRELPDPHYYNQAILLEVKQPLAVSAVEHIVGELLLHHDALRLRFVREASGWRQFIAAPDDTLPLVAFDLSELGDAEIGAAIEAESAKLQISFDLAAGPLARFAYFDLGESRAARLLLVLHHLVVDGVSWRILIEDLVLAWDRLELPAKTTSFKSWAERLAVHAKSEELQREASYWLSTARQSATPLPVDHADAPNTLASAHTVTTRLDQNQTHALLHEVSETYHTQINDLLLTALAQACARWTGNQSLLIDLEGHGREPLFDDVDTTRTVGWFTTHFPVLLKLEEKLSTSEALRAVKEQLRQIPNRGIGYGMLRYLSDDSAIVDGLQALPQPEMSFNYLGQFDHVLPETAPFKLASEPIGETQSRRGDLSYLLRVNASVSGGELQVLWTYSRNVYEQSTIENLGQEFQRALQSLIAECLSARTASYTPADFPDADLSQKDLDAIVSNLSGTALEDVYRLSPMQEGMLFQSLYNREGDAYFRQMSIALHGELNVAAFEQAWRRVVEFHPALRTSFFWRGTDRPVQVVQRNVPLSLEIHDWREAAPEVRDEKLQTYLREQQTHAFDLEKAPLIRLGLIRLEDQVYRFVWSYHHILIDGWSRALINKDVLALYEAFAAGREAGLEPRRPFRDYIRWLQRQDLTKAETYWRDKLRGFVVPPPLSEVSEQETGDFTKVLSRQLSTELTSALQSIARQHQLTLNTFVQGAWAIVLAQLSGMSDVVFGVVASGRAIDLPGSESIIGPFLNTLPVRIQLSTEVPLLAWLRTIQQQQQELREFEHSPLSDVQRWSDAPRGRALFETVVNFTNYYVDSSLRRTNDRLEARDPSLVERVHYAMVLEVEPGPSLRLLLLHDSRRFDEETIADVLRQVETLLTMMASGADRRLGDLSQSEKAELPQLTMQGEDKKEYALSYHQERLWFIDQFERGNVYESSPTYHNIPLILELRGAIDVELLESSLNAVIERHEALRTRIVTKDGITRQIVKPNEILKLEVAHRDEGEAQRPFIIDEDPLVRATLIRGEDDESTLVITVHHIIADKQSLQLIAEELAEIYTARSEGRVPQLPEPQVQYNQYSEWQLGFGKDVLEPLLSYWKRQLGGGLRALELPEDRTRPAVHTYTAATTKFLLNKRFARRIEQLCLQERSTAFTVVLAAFKALLHRYANQDEIVVGTSAANRNQPGTEDVIGPIANLLVLRSNVAGNPTFRSFLVQVTKTVEQAYRHQEMPFDKLVLELNPEKDMSRTALFDVLFNFETEEPGELEFGDATARIVDANLGYGKYDLNLLVRRSAQGLSGTVVYNSDIYNDTTIEQMMRHFEVMLEAVISHPDRNIDDVVLLSEAEEQQQLATWNSTEAAYPEDKTIHELFELQAQRTPERIAVVDGETSLTYRELDQRANRLAHRLREQGVGPDVLVAVCLDKSAEMIVALLAILKAGGGYLPLNPEFPEERLRFMIEDSRARHLVTSESGAKNIEKWVANVVFIDRDSDGVATEGHPNNPCNVAYCIYTSGSTGRPKGVLVEHRNVVRLMLNDKHQFDFNENDVWTMFHSYSFDFSVWEMYGALLYGGKLVIVSQDQMKDPLLFLDLLAEQKVTVLNQTPSAFNNLSSEALKRGETDLALRYVIFGGEELHPIQLKEWRQAYPHVKLINMYGITETTVHVTFKEITEREIEANVSNLGVPIPTTTTYIFDSKLRLLPIGVPGEVCVGGLGVSRGYLDRDELTGQKFIANPYKLEERIYRSGDLAKRLPNGEMVYLGRIDDQVQIRGFRVELGEVCSHLLEHPSVAKAEIIARRSQADIVELVAYVEPSSDVSIAELRQHLAQTLPYYMVPSTFVILKTLPMTPNGKVDRKALPPPNAVRETEVSESRLNVIQEVVASIWAEVLEIERVEPTDNFLELGGHSLMATRVFSRIREAFQVELPLKTLFDAPQLTELAAVIEKAMRSDSEAIELPLVPVPRDKDLPASFGQHGLWVINRLEPHSHLYNLPFALRMKGNLNIDALARCLATLTERHESLRTTFKGGDNRQAWQVISPTANTKVITRDLRHLSDSEREAEAHRLAVEEAQKPFDLEHGPLLRVVLLQLGDEDYTLLFNMHHIITDGWSFEVLAREVGILYEAYSRGLTPVLPELPIQYADYAVWQRESLRGERLDRELDYWRQQLDGMQTLRLPTQQTSARSGLGASRSIHLSSSLAASLGALSRREGVTLFITLLAAFKTLLYRYTGQEDIVVGTPMTNRGRREVENLIGYFVNMVPLRTELAGNPTFRELLTRVRQTTLGAYAHQDVPMQRLLKEFNLERQVNRAIPFPAVFILQNTPASPLQLPDVTISAVDIFKQTTPADLYLAATEMSDGILAGFKYSVDLFADKMIGKMLANFEGLLETVVAQPEIRLLDIPFGEGSGASSEASEKARAFHADQFSF